MGDRLTRDLNSVFTVRTDATPNHKEKLILLKTCCWLKSQLRKYYMAFILAQSVERLTVGREVAGSIPRS